jgi:hypothetical protein
MPSAYTVVQYVPDPIADERINVGVLVFGDGRIRSRFIKSWTRVKHFGKEDVEFLRDFERRVGGWSPDELPLPGLAKGPMIGDEALATLTGSWVNSVQLTPSRASLLDSEALLDEMCRQFLKEPVRTPRGARDKRAAAAMAIKAIRFELDAAHKAVALKRQVQVTGFLESHLLDFGLQNGQLLRAGAGLSFEGRPTRPMVREIDATKWAFDDIQKAGNGPRLTVVALPPKSGFITYDKAAAVFRDLGAEVVRAEEVGDWAKDVVAAI